MEIRDFEKQISEKEGSMSLLLPALMRKVYVWMTFALVITGLTAYGVANSPYLLNIIFSNRMIMFGLIILDFALVVGVSAAINRITLTTATLLFVLYSIINGVVMSSIFIGYSTAIITKVFLITAGTFGTMSLIGYTTKSDLSGLGKMLFMALIGVIIATVVNIFLKSSALDMIISYIGVIVFVGLTAYDTQKIKHILTTCHEMDEGAMKLSLIGALTLYLDFLNLFLYLLRIFGRK